MTSLIENLKNLQESYKQKVNFINMNLKKKYFSPILNNNIHTIKITSYDDMYKEMYFKHKYFNDSLLLNNISIEYPNSGNIIKDILFLTSKFDIKYVHDNKFKVSKYNNELNKFNYFNSKNENDIILYNSIDSNTFQQSEFRNQINQINITLKDYYSKIYINNQIEMTFYEDEKYDMNWIIISISQI